ncbi:TnsA endonuclease N-terminal domain-containing protein [Ruegeria sp. MALMAid1280]|uniref:TnsA endonuclease N-terminal domain-containing protein n=1 Tax=Ruegeria sp. MALMAid1280 TaxID=3411634 RepID=UPI003BA11989
MQFDTQKKVEAVWDAQRVSNRSKNNMNDNDDSSDRGDLAPLPSRATRNIPKRSRASSRGAILAHLPSDNHTRVIQYESKLEQRVLWLFLANKDVVDIREQPVPVFYTDHLGRRKSHVFDFWVQLRSGRRLAVAVKPAKHALKRNFARELRHVRRSMRKTFADDVVLITDQDFQRGEAINAQRYCEFSWHRCRQTEIELRELLASVELPARISALCDQLAKGGKGFRAVFLAIYDGLLVADLTRPIGMDTLVTVGGAA